MVCRLFLKFSAVLTEKITNSYLPTRRTISRSSFNVPRILVFHRFTPFPTLNTALALKVLDAGDTDLVPYK